MRRAARYDNEGLDANRERRHVAVHERARLLEIGKKLHGTEIGNALWLVTAQRRYVHAPRPPCAHLLGAGGVGGDGAGVDVDAPEVEAIVTDADLPLARMARRARDGEVALDPHEGARR